MATYLIGNIKGPKGADGVSPTAKVEQTTTGATITITDATGTTTADIRNGVDSDGNNIDLTPYAKKTEVAETYATKTYVDAAVDAVDAPVTSVNGMVGAVTITETDPTVPAWAKQPNKPAYTAAEVGALPDTTFIPTVPTNVSAFNNDAGYVNSTDVQTALSAKQDALIAGPNITIENNVISATGGSSFSGDYDDLTNKPDLSIYAETANLATVATSGSYNDLTNKPTIPTVPTNVSDFTNDAGYITSSDLPADELPTIASGDAGKVLTVNSGENGVEWTTPASGGGGGVTYTAGDGIEIDANNVISAIDRPASLSDPIFQLFRSSASMYPAIGGNEGHNLTTIEALANSLNKNGIAVVDGFDLYSITPTLVNAVNNTTWKFEWFKIDSTTGNITSTLYDANSTENFGSFRQNRAFALCGGIVFAFDNISSAQNILHNSFVSATKTKAGTNYGSVDIFSALSALDTAITNKQNTLTAGTGITIENNVISATSSGGGSSYTDNDVYNAIQNRFGMARSEETHYFTTGSVTGNDGNATLTTDGIGQTNGIRISNSDGGDPYLDYPVQWDEALSDEVWVANYDGNTYRITSAWDEQTQKQTLTIAYPTALFGTGEKGLDVQHYSTSYTTTPLSYGYYNFDTIYNEMQNRGMGGGGGGSGFTPTGNGLIAWTGSEASRVLGAEESTSTSEVTLYESEVTFDASGNIINGALSNDIAHALWNGEYNWKAMLDVGWAGLCQTDRQQCVSYRSMYGIPDAGAQTLDMSLETTLMDDTYGQLAAPWNITIRFTCSNPVEGMYEWGHIENISASVVGFSSWPSGFENAGTMYFRIVNMQTSTNRTPINADFIPVDGSTIQIEGGQIMARGRVEMPALAPSAIYLYGQDGNTYEITVDSTGTLKATRYQN